MKVIGKVLLNVTLITIVATAIISTIDLFFGEEVEMSKSYTIQKGQVYREYEKYDNPFVEPRIDTLTVLDVKEGYVLYFSNKFKQKESTRQVNFIKYCTLIDSIDYDNNSK